MRFLQAGLRLFVALTTLAGCSHSVILTSPGAPNRFAIHLQEGFDGRQAIIAVDGLEVYRGKPKTDPRLGFAAGFSAGAASIHPVVTLAIPSRRVHWLKQIDLSAGHVVGISVTQSGLMEVHQAPKFFEYE